MQLFLSSHTLDTMASLMNFTLVLPLCLLLIISYPPNTLSQDPISSSPTIAQCTSSLLPLIPCAPFVQGTAPSPGPQCCANLKQLYIQEPHCLCLLLNGTTFTSFPINKTLALQLPTLCSLEVDISACPGEQVQVAPTSPHSQFSPGTRNNSTVAASPAFSVPPRPRMMGYGFGTSKASLKENNGIIVSVALLLSPFVLY